MINFYRSGIRLRFDEGRLSSVTAEKFPDRATAAANLPDLSFLQMLFGRKTFSEIHDLLVDAWSGADDDELLMDTLFPKMSSDTSFAVS